MWVAVLALLCSFSVASAFRAPLRAPTLSRQLTPQLERGLRACEPALDTPLPLLERPLPQVALCTAGYLVHVCTLSRRSLRLGGLDLGLDTLAGGTVLLAAMLRRRSRGRKAVPTWLSSNELAEEASACFNAREESARGKLRLLSTAVMLMVAPVFFTFLSPFLEAAVYLLAIFVPLTQASLLGARLLVEQSVLYLALCKLIQIRHPEFFSSRWVRWSWRGPWLLPVLGGYNTKQDSHCPLVSPLPPSYPLRPAPPFPPPVVTTGTPLQSRFSISWSH